MPGVECGRSDPLNRAALLFNPLTAVPDWLFVRCQCTLHKLRSACLYPKNFKAVPLVSSSKPPKQKRSYSCSFALPNTLRLSQVALYRLRRHAEAIGVNEAELARDLLEAIALDDPYDAVLDRAKIVKSAFTVPRTVEKLCIKAASLRTRGPDPFRDLQL